jgi:hypothetical protein
LLTEHQCGIHWHMMPRVGIMCHSYPEPSSEGAGTTGSATPVSPTSTGAGRFRSRKVGRRPAGACRTGHRHMGVRCQLPRVGTFGVAAFGICSRLTAR